MNTKNYRTRQEFVTDNTIPKGKDYIIGLDVGYSGTKVFYETGYFCIPSFAKKLTKGVPLMAGDKDILYKEDGSDDIYMVGYSAQNMLNDNDTNDTESELFSRKRYSNKQFQIIRNVALGIAIMNKKDNREISVQTGLPSAYLEGDTPLIKKAISKPTKFWIKVGTKEWVECENKINSEKIFTMQQPAGGFYSALIQKDGNYIPNVKDILSGKVLVMDIGFGTFDFFASDKSYLDSINDIGMREIFDIASKNILNDTGEDIRVAALQKYLEKGKFNVVDDEEMTSEERSLAPYLEKANEKVFEEMKDKVKNITNTLRGFDNIVISGGTGEAWLEDIRKWLEGLGKTVIPANINDRRPMIYSNVRGYYMYRYNNNRR